MFHAFSRTKSAKRLTMITNNGVRCNQIDVELAKLFELRTKLSNAVRTVCFIFDDISDLHSSFMDHMKFSNNLDIAEQEPVIRRYLFLMLGLIEYATFLWTGQVTTPYVAHLVDPHYDCHLLVGNFEEKFRDTDDTTRLSYFSIEGFRFTKKIVLDKCTTKYFPGLMVNGMNINSHLSFKFNCYRCFICYRILKAIEYL